MITCIYCNEEKKESEFSEEHIWPEALGGDCLSDFWRTKNVCRRCNSISGLFVDGEFIKGIGGNIEQFTSASEYIDIDNPPKINLPLAYLGKIQDIEIENGTIADFWVVPNGGNIIHFRPEDQENIWASYAGGEPRMSKNKTESSRVYVVLTSTEKYWILACLAAVKAHFKNAECFIVNMEVSAECNEFKTYDPNNPIHKKDAVTVENVISAGRNSRNLRCKFVVRKDTGDRFLAKLGLAIGYKLLGAPFLQTDSAKFLRKGFGEAKYEKRQKIPVRGKNYLSENIDKSLLDFLSWAGAWVLIIWIVASNLTLIVISPSGNFQCVVVSNEIPLIQNLCQSYEDGIVWLTVPTLGESVGPLSLVDYISHRFGNQIHEELSSLEYKQKSYGTGIQN